VSVDFILEIVITGNVSKLKRLLNALEKMQEIDSTSGIGLLVSDYDLQRAFIKAAECNQLEMLALLWPVCENQHASQIMDDDSDMRRSAEHSTFNSGLLKAAKAASANGHATVLQYLKVFLDTLIEQTQVSDDFAQNLRKQFHTTILLSAIASAQPQIFSFSDSNIPAPRMKDLLKHLLFPMTTQDLDNFASKWRSALYELPDFTTLCEIFKRFPEFEEKAVPKLFKLTKESFTAQELFYTKFAACNPKEMQKLRKKLVFSCIKDIRIGQFSILEQDAFFQIISTMKIAAGKAEICLSTAGRLLREAVNPFAAHSSVTISKDISQIGQFYSKLLDTLHIRSVSLSEILGHSKSDAPRHNEASQILCSLQQCNNILIAEHDAEFSELSNTRLATICKNTNIAEQLRNFPTFQTNFSALQQRIICSALDFGTIIEILDNTEHSEYFENGLLETSESYEALVSFQKSVTSTSVTPRV